MGDCALLPQRCQRVQKVINIGVRVQGNLKSSHMVTGGNALVSETRRIVDALSGGPHIFNLGHGITPDANPENVQLMIDTVRGNA